MMPTSPDRTGVLIVRLWIEANHEQGLRARITQTLDSTAGDQSVSAVASADAICAAVQQWVEDFVAPGSPDGNGHAGPGNGTKTQRIEP
ncbi:MAG TPA: hypothetical protein VGB64_14500 [Actinomycetota bacterium]